VEYLVALLLTLAIEVPIVVALLTRDGRPRLTALPVAVLVNLISHPVAFLVVEPVIDGSLGDTLALVVVELAVMAGEAFGLARLGRVDGLRGVQLSAIANGTSVLVGGLLIGALVG
jgi:hypothetical protein